MPTVASLKVDDRVIDGLSAVQRELGTARVSLWGSGGETLSLLAATGHSEADRNPVGLTLPRGYGLVGSSADKQVVIATQDAAGEHAHLNVSLLTNFQPRAILSLPIVFRGETWGVLQLLDESPRQWTDTDLATAKHHVNQLFLTLLEKVVPSSDFLGSNPLATMVLNAGFDRTVKEVEGTVLCLDLMSSTQYLDTSHGTLRGSPLERLSLFFRAAVLEVERHGGIAINTAGDAITFLFQGRSITDRESRAVAAASDIHSRFDELRSNPQNAGKIPHFHCAVASGSLEIGLLESASGPVHCFLGQPLHHAFAMTKTLGPLQNLTSVPGVTVV